MNASHDTSIAGAGPVGDLSPSDNKARERFWRGEIRRTRRRLRLGWWSSAFLRCLWPLAALSMLVLLGVRCFQGAVEPILPAALAGAVVLVSAVAAAVWSRRRLVTEEQAVVRLESQIGTRGVLTAAFAGMSHWPPLPVAVDDGLNWRWSRVAAPVLAALILMGAGAWMPLPGSLGSQTQEEPLPPLVWEQMEHALEQLEQENLIAEDAMEEWRERLQTLTGRDPGEWFAHNTLEASDHLQESLEKAMQDLQQQMMEAAAAVGALERMGEELSEEARTALSEQLDKALQAMENGALPLNPDTLQALADQARELAQMNLTPEQMEAMKERLAECMQCLNAAMGEGGANQQAVEQMMEMLAQAGQAAEREGGMGEGQGQPGQADHGSRDGRGGPMDTGPGDTPLTLQDQPTHLSGGRDEALAPVDPDRFIPGEAVGEGLAEHESGEGPAPVQAGGAAVAGQGGARVSQERLLPQEQEAVRRFFDDQR